MKDQDLMNAINKMCDSINNCDSHKDRTINFIVKKCNEYSEALDLTPLEVFNAMEKARTYSYPNYYQEANFPDLTEPNVFLFKSMTELQETVKKENGFICPACDGISTSATRCNCKKDDGTECDWAAYGLFRTMGKGIYIAVKDEFVAHPIVQEIFVPVAMQGMLHERLNMSPTTQDNCNDY
ncbi:hypothetical protein [Photobacterium damselae]|uniref:hypothetical protein n=1 Tax=Photobacterium damselae TaxID=38293 RepID=UPI0040679332